MKNFWKSEETDEIICLCHLEIPTKFTTKVRTKFSIKDLRFKKILIIKKTTVCNNCNSKYVTKLTSTNFDKEIDINALINELLPLINRAWVLCENQEQGPLLRTLNKSEAEIPSAPPAEDSREE